VTSNGQTTAKAPTASKSAAAGSSAAPAPAAPKPASAPRPAEEQKQTGGPDFAAPVARPAESTAEGDGASLDVQELSSPTKPASKLSFRERLGFAKKDEPKTSTQPAPTGSGPASAPAQPSSASSQSAPQTQQVAAQTATSVQARTAPAPVPAGTPTATPGAGLHTDTAEIPAVPASVTPVAPHPPEQLGAAPKPKPGAARRTRKARLRLSRLDPWSVMKTSFLFSIAAGIMLVVAVYVVWTVIGASSLFDSVNEIVKSVVSTPGDTTPFRIQEYINTQKVMGVAALLACVDVVIFTALATLGSFLYNLAATMLGGLEITLAED